MTWKKAHSPTLPNPLQAASGLGNQTQVIANTQLKAQNILTSKEEVLGAFVC